MNFKLLFFVIIFSLSFCFAQPSIVFQNEEIQPLESILGSFSSTNQFTSDQIKVYEERREISFEKGVIYFNNTTYFYLIPSKEGDFRIEIKNILYNDAGTLSSVNLEKNFSVKYENSSEREILTLRPGVIYSDSPTVFIINSGDNNLEVEYSEEEYNLSKGAQQKVTLENTASFYFAEIKSYKTFLIPVIFINKSSPTIKENSSQANNTSLQNETTSEENIAQRNIELNLISNSIEKENITLNYSENSNLTLKTKSNLVKNSTLTSNSLDLELFSSKEGFFSENLEIYENDKLKENITLKIIFLKNETELVKFQESNTGETCEDLGGNLCSINENCEGEFVSAGGICCFVTCTEIGTNKKDPLDYFIGIIIVAILSVIGYFIYKKNKNSKLPNALDKFKDAEKSYQNKNLGKK